MMFGRKKNGENGKGHIFSWRNWRESMHENNIVKQSLEELIQSSSLGPRFFVMSIISGLMAMTGILLNDIVILIGSMVLAPFLNPILALAAGIVLGHFRLIWHALKGFIGGFMVVIAIIAGAVRLLFQAGHEIEIATFLEKFSDEKSIFLIAMAAVLSGFAAVYAWVRSENNANIVGVAIAVSLIPLISFLGILIGVARFDLFPRFAGFLAMNLAGIVGGSVLAFISMRFTHSKSRISQHIKRTEKDV